MLHPQSACSHLLPFRLIGFLLSRPYSTSCKFMLSARLSKPTTRQTLATLHAQYFWRDTSRKSSSSATNTAEQGTEQSNSATAQPKSRPRQKNSQNSPRPTLPTTDLKHTYLKGSGPGGQKINKTSSAVQITHLPTGIVVKSQATRSRSQNHTIARRILAEKVDNLEKGQDSWAAKKADVKRKKKASATKKARRKYRELEETKDGNLTAESNA